MIRDARCLGRSLAFLCSFAFHAGAVTLCAAAPDADAERLAPERIVFLLEYIGADYGGAVQNGKVADPLEHREMTEFSQAVAEQYASAGGSEQTSAEITRLQGLIRDLRPWAEVRALCVDLASKVSEELGAVPRPAFAPDIDRGRGLYIQACAVCHGPEGGGDGRAARGMEPPPTSFREPRMNLVRPRQVHAAMAFGVDGTAMPSFTGAFTTQQLWDLAFFVMTLREDFDPKTPDGEISLSLADLAGSSNEELLARLRGVRPQTAPSDIDYHRLQPPGPSLEPSRAGRERTTGTLRTEPGPDIEAALVLEDAFAHVAERVFPSVVGLSFYARDDKKPAERGPGWREASQAEPPYPGYRLMSTASGFFVSDDGYILSCHHPLIDKKTGKPAEIIDVESSGNQHFRARVIGIEPTVNLAVLRAEAPTRTAPAVLGADDLVRVGQWAIALGDPPGVERIFVPGTISARPERDCYQEQRTSTLLQTSLTIPWESFGGPLVNIRGEVIGISIPRTTNPGVPEEAPGPVFALPIHLAMTLYDALKVKESQRSPWLGISVLELSWKLRKALKSAPMTGVYIDDVFDPSPASRIGIRVGDILTAIDENRIYSVKDFQTWLYLLGIGRAVSLEIYRDAEILRKQVTIEERPAEATTR